MPYKTKIAGALPGLVRKYGIGSRSERMRLTSGIAAMNETPNSRAHHTDVAVGVRNVDIDSYVQPTFSELQGSKLQSTDLPRESFPKLKESIARTKDGLEFPTADYPRPSKASFPTQQSVIQEIVASKLDVLTQALDEKDYNQLTNIFMANSYWRDHLGINGRNLTTLTGIAKIIPYLKEQSTNNISNFTTRKGHEGEASSIDLKGEIKCIQCFINFETDAGNGRGVLKLLQDVENDDEWRIFSLFTTLSELKGTKQTEPYHSVPSGWGKELNWKEYREEKKEFVREEPAVLIVGAGHSGLMTAARLGMMGIDALIIDKQERSGDAWRLRYHDLILHDTRWMNAMPYIDYPPNWPLLASKDKVADFFEHYESILELNVWNRSQIIKSSYDEKEKTWTVEIRKIDKDGKQSKRVLRPRHIVQATGLNGEPYIPGIPGVGKFRGKVAHAANFTEAVKAYASRKVVVVGAGCSAHDIALSCHRQGAKVTMIQRSPIHVASIEISHRYWNKRWNKHTPVEDSDLLTFSIPTTMQKRIGHCVTQQTQAHDSALLGGLRAVGFCLPTSSILPSLIPLAFERGGGFYIDVGCSSKIASGEISHYHSPNGISHITSTSLVLSDYRRTEVEADEIVFATGYSNGSVRTKSIFGDEVARKVGQIWGIDEEGELRAVWRRTGQEGFWVAAGGFWLSRYYSRLLALQIAMDEKERDGKVV